MTALIYLLTPGSVCLAMDSLASYPSSKEPFKYASKIYLLPHLQAAICGTGTLELSLEWFMTVQRKIVAKDIRYLDQIAQEQLSGISQNLRSIGDPSGTVYHFGYDQAEQRFIGFAYRSERGFQSERLIDSLGIKPPDGEDIVADLAVIAADPSPKPFEEIMRRQKFLDDPKPASEKVGIGGEVHFLSLTSDGFFLCTIHRWDDYNALFVRMLQNLQSFNRSSQRAQRDLTSP